MLPESESDSDSDSEWVVFGEFVWVFAWFHICSVVSPARRDVFVKAEVTDSYTHAGTTTTTTTITTTTTTTTTITTTTTTIVIMIIIIIVIITPTSYSDARRSQCWAGLPPTTTRSEPLRAVCGCRP